MQIVSWIAPSTVRLYPRTAPSRGPAPGFDVAANEQFSFQVAVRSEEAEPQRVRVEARGPSGWTVRVRRVGYVPLAHFNTPAGASDDDLEGRGQVPGYVPDPLFDEDNVLLAAAETHAFWITVRPGGAAPGRHAIRVTVLPERGRPRSHAVRGRVRDLVLAGRRDFSVTHWFYNDALIDWYRTDLFDARFWKILPRYVRDVVEHGQDTLYVPVFTPPLDGVKRPSQLLGVTRAGRGRYRFDWRDVERYVALARRGGVERFEWCHPFTQWGAAHAIRVYEGQGRGEKRLWPPGTGATSPAYRAFLSQYLPELHGFLAKRRILDRSFFHVSDEPHSAEHLVNYRKARAALRELAPWMKVMDALSEIRFAREGLTDMPVPTTGAALDFVKEGFPCWCYYCCVPRGAFVNRLLDTPLAKIAMHGMLFYRWAVQGFLHWGYNYWYKSQTRTLIDPFTVQDGLSWPGWASGDPFVVYPGPDGPIDSMRWEVFGESLQDYRLLQTLGVSRDAPLLAPLRSFRDFPKRAGWRTRARAALLRGAAPRRSPAGARTLLRDGTFSRAVIRRPRNGGGRRRGGGDLWRRLREKLRVPADVFRAGPGVGPNDSTPKRRGAEAFVRPSPAAR